LELEGAPRPDRGGKNSRENTSRAHLAGRRAGVGRGAPGGGRDDPRPAGRVGPDASSVPTGGSGRALSSALYIVGQDGGWIARAPRAATFGAKYGPKRSGAEGRHPGRKKRFHAAGTGKRCTPAGGSYKGRGRARRAETAGEWDIWLPNPRPLHRVTRGSITGRRDGVGGWDKIPLVCPKMFKEAAEVEPGTTMTGLRPLPVSPDPPPVQPRAARSSPNHTRSLTGGEVPRGHRRGSRSHARSGAGGGDLVKWKGIGTSAASHSTQKTAEPSSGKGGGAETTRYWM